MLNLDNVLRTLKVKFSVRESGARTFYTVACPMCSPSAKHRGDSGAFSASGNTLTWTCWRGCKHTHGAVGMLSEISGVPIKDVFKVLADNSDNLFYKKTQQMRSKALLSPVNIGVDSLYGSYLKSRGFRSNELSKRYELIFTPHTLYVYRNREEDKGLFLQNNIIFPVYSKYGELTSFSGRTIDPNNPKRYSIPKKEDEVVPIKTSGLGFAQAGTDTLIICEGNYDMCKIGGVAPCGISYTTGFVDTVLEFWKQHKCKICVMFDPGEKQAKRQQQKLENELSMIIGNDLIKYKYPFEHDLGDCTKDEIQHICNELSIQRDLSHLDKDWRRK